MTEALRGPNSIHTRPGPGATTVVPQGRFRPAAWLALPALAVALAATLASTAAVAGDRPFSQLQRAVWEDDDEQVLSLDLNHRRSRDLRSTGLGVEYAVSPAWSLEVELGWQKDRAAGTRERSVELAGQYLFNNIARDDYGLGIAASVEWSRPSGAAMAYEKARIVGVYSRPIGAVGAGFVHVNLGLQDDVNVKKKAPRVVWAVGIEHDLASRTVGFAEFAAVGLRPREAELHLGVRQWIRREKLAVDISVAREVQRAFAGGERKNSVMLNLSFYDIKL